MKKQFVFYAFLFLFGFHPSFSQSLLDDENSVDLSAWKNASWKEISDLTIAPLSNKVGVVKGKGVLLAEGNSQLVFPAVNKSYLLSFNCKIENQSQVYLALTKENKLSLSKSEFGTIVSTLGENKPEVNAARATGLWQTVEVSVDHAKNLPGFILINFIKVNNLIVLQHVILPVQDLQNNHLMFEVSKGMFALKNLKLLEQSDIKPISLTGLKGEVWEEFNWDKVSSEGFNSMAKADLSGLNYDIGQGVSKKNFLAKYDGTLNVDQAGIYNFTFDISGKFMVLIDNKIVFPFTDDFYNRNIFTKKLELSKGKHSFHLEFLKAWMRPALGMTVSGNGAKPYALNELTSLPEIKNYGNIKFDPTIKTEVIRGFYMHNGIKNTTALATGFTSKYNFAMDIEKGSLLTVWKGNFTDMSEMWHERGEPQTFKANGMFVNLSGKDILLDQKNAVVNINYESQQMDVDNSPTFTFSTPEKASFTQQILPNGNGFGVKVNFEKTSNTKLVLARGGEILKVENGVYKIGNYYIQVNEKAKADIIQLDNEFVLTVPAQGMVSYNLIW